MQKTKLIVVAGPTASGKTSLGIEIAKAVNGEIVCADSMQVYKGMPIATAAPTQYEKSQVPHHLNECIDSSEDFSVFRFVDMAKAEIDDIVSRHKVPIIVGGTGLFIDSLVDGRIFTQSQTDFALREKLMQKSNDELYDELKRIDSDSALKIHKNNKSRVVRALELYYTTGSTKTQQDINSVPSDLPYDTLYFVIDYMDRHRLYDRINKRADLMLDDGLVDEAKTALSQNGRTSSQAIGHKELKKYFDGDESLNTALDNLKKETRHYAKRQITWFKKRQNAIHLVADDNTSEELCSLAIKKASDFLNE